MGELLLQFWKESINITEQRQDTRTVPTYSYHYTKRTTCALRAMRATHARCAMLISNAPSRPRTSTAGSWHWVDGSDVGGR